MKKSLLFSAALAAAATSFAAAPMLQKADLSALSEPRPVKAAEAAAQMRTRAEGEMQSLEFSYAGNAGSAYSLNGVTPGQTRVYLGFEMTPEDIRLFKGSQVTAFSMLSSATDGTKPNTITEGRFFYCIDVAQEAYTQDFSISPDPVALNTIDLNSPYTITGEENAIVFGYSFIVPADDDMGYLITDGAPANAGSCIFGMSDTDAFPTQLNVIGDQVGALCMAVRLEMEELPKFVSFTSFPEDICLVKGEQTVLPITISATSVDPIESITLAYTLGGIPEEITYSAGEPIPGGIGLQLNVGIGFPAVSEYLNEPVEFRLTKINGQDNVCEGNAVSATVVVVDQAPTHRALYEEYTGVWCGYCPRGFAALEYMRENYPELVTASFHYGQGTSRDPMQVLNFYPTNVSGFPSAVLNRNEVVDPYYGTYNYDMLVPVVGDMLAINEVNAVWDVNVAHEWESEDRLVAKAEVSTVAGYEDRNYKIAYLLVADSLSGKSASWRQSNYYSSQAQSPNNAPQLNQFCRNGAYGKSMVTGLVFNDVVVSAEGVMGIEGSVPASLAANEVVSHSLTFDISKISSTLIPDKKKLRVIAMLLDKNGQVLNCAKDEVNDEYGVSTAVEGIESADAPVEFYNLNGMKVAQPTEGIYIRRQGGKAEKIIIR